VLRAPSGADSPPKQQPIEAKESYKWLLALRQSVKDRPAGVQVVAVCDRESDIFEFFDLARRLRAPLVVRAAQDRNAESEEEVGHLWKMVQARPVAGTLQVHISARKGQPARDAELQIRYLELKLQPPRNRQAAGRRKKAWRAVRVWAVLTTEINPPAGVKPISWLLLTSVPVGNFQDACERIAWYSQRWKIEVFFDVLENGCKVEDRRLRTKQRLMRCLAVYMVVAARLHRLTMLAREEPEASCLTVLSTEEWQTLYCFINKTKQLPDHPPSLRQALRWIAQLGGFLGRKCDGEPGIRTVWRGWQRLQDLVGMWLVIHEICE
jgi:hypothetical protein